MAQLGRPGLDRQPGQAVDPSLRRARVTFAVLCALVSWFASFPVGVLLTVLSEPAGKFGPDAYGPVTVIFLGWWSLVVAAARPLSRNISGLGVNVRPGLVGLTTVAAHALTAGTMILVLKEVELLTIPLGESFSQSMLALAGIAFFASQPAAAVVGAYLGTVWSQRRAGG